MIAPYVEQALEYTYHPFLRTTLESARCLAIISLMIGIVFTLNSHQDLNRYLELFIIGGTLTSIYGLYQTLVLRYSLSLALIPETLYHENSTRPFSTFYEPTGLGSYTAASTLLALYFIYTKRRVGRVFWILNFGLNVMGLWLSLSRAGLMGLGAGILILAIILSITFKVKRLFSGLIISFLVFYILYFAVRYILSDTMDFGLSFFWWQQSMKERQESYGQLLSLLGVYPTGVGQGNFLFIGAGAPGFARLLVEGGLLGLILLLMMHSYALLCLTSILRSRLHYFRQIGPYIAAAYISCLTTTANYISTTDSWIWFIWSLPAFACTLERKAIEDPFKAPSDLDIPAAARPPAW
jgi:hypothetical protein